MRSPASGPRRRVALLPLLLVVLGALGFAANAWANQERGRIALSPIFTGAAVGDFSAQYAAPGAITEVSDPAGSGQEVLSLTVSNRDVFPVTPTENPRAVLASPSFVKAGMDVWLSTKFLVPISYPRIRPGGWVSLVSFYGPPYDSSSPWQLELVGNRLQWQRNSTYGFDIPFQAPLVKGRWTSVLVHERFARRGFVELWIDGKPIEFFGTSEYNPRHHEVTRRLEMATVDRSNDRGPNSARIGQYRKAGLFSSGTLYFGALRVGHSRASVTP
jgi:hypothetical protein